MTDEVLILRQDTNIATPPELGWQTSTLTFPTGLPASYDIGDGFSLRFVNAWTPLRELNLYEEEDVILSSDPQTLPPGTDLITKEFDSELYVLVIKNSRLVGHQAVRANMLFRVVSATSNSACAEIAIASWCFSVDALTAGLNAKASISLSYRLLGKGVDNFEEPKLNKYMLRRLDNSSRIESFSQRPTVASSSGVIR